MKMKMTTDNIKTLDDLHRRKVALRRKMNVQRTEILDTFDHLKEDFNPTHLLKSAVTGLLNTSEGSAEIMSSGVSRGVSAFASGFVKNPKTALVVRMLLPFALQYLPKILGFVRENVPNKAGFYGFLRHNVGRLRHQLN